MKGTEIVKSTFSCDTGTNCAQRLKPLSEIFLINAVQWYSDIHGFYYLIINVQFIEKKNVERDMSRLKRHKINDIFIEQI